MQGLATSRAHLCHTEMPGPHGQVSGVDSTRPRPRAPLSAKHTRTGQSSARSSTYSYSTHTKYACIHAVRAYSSAGSSTHTLAERPITAGKWSGRVIALSGGKLVTALQVLVCPLVTLSGRARGVIVPLSAGSALPGTRLPFGKTRPRPRSRRA